MGADRFQTIQNESPAFEVLVQEYADLSEGIHFQPEIQVSLILEGKATLFISGQIQALEVGNVMLIGPEVPHSLICQTAREESLFRMISLCFLPDALGQQFFNLAEMRTVKTLLAESAGGIVWGKEFGHQIESALRSLETVASSPQRIIILLEILQKMAYNSSRTTVSAHSFSGEISSSDYTFSKILQHIYQNFDQPISLEDMAALVNLNKYSFCRYFKRMTHMSFVSYLNNFRISKACRFLTMDSYNISQIGYLVGYNTLSNFYHQFNKIMKCTPSEYREGGELKLGGA